MHDERRVGQPCTYKDDNVAEAINRALQIRPPDGRRHWSAETLSAATVSSNSTVHRRLQIYSLQPHRLKTYRCAEASKLKVVHRSILCREGPRHRRAVPDPTDESLGFCVDENTKILALDRTQPLLPMVPGYVEGVTHDYICHGITTLFAALDVVIVEERSPSANMALALGFPRLSAPDRSVRPLGFVRSTHRG